MVDVVGPSRFGDDARWELLEVRVWVLSPCGLVPWILSM